MPRLGRARPPDPGGDLALSCKPVAPPCQKAVGSLALPRFNCQGLLGVSHSSVRSESRSLRCRDRAENPVPRSTLVTPYLVPG